MTTINIVLDIDGVLADAESEMTEDRFLFFFKTGAIISAANHLHYVFPGVIPLLKKLYSYDNVKVSFFSAAIKERNHEFVEKLLTLALGEARYQQIAPTLIIRSRDDLTTHQGDRKTKDLLSIVPPEQLPHTILVDDSFCYEDTQAANFLKSRWVQTQKFSESVSSEVNSDIWHRTNSAYYLAGRLIHLIEAMSVDNSNTVYNQFFRCQFPSGTGPQFFNWEVFLDRSVYEFGLAALQVIESNLSLITTEYYQSVQASPLFIFDKEHHARNDELFKRCKTLFSDLRLEDIDWHEMLLHKIHRPIADYGKTLLSQAIEDKNSDELEQLVSLSFVRRYISARHFINCLNRGDVQIAECLLPWVGQETLKNFFKQPLLESIRNNNIKAFLECHKNAYNNYYSYFRGTQSSAVALYRLLNPTGRPYLMADDLRANDIAFDYDAGLKYPLKLALHVNASPVIIETLLKIEPYRDFRSTQFPFSPLLRLIRAKEDQSRIITRIQNEIPQAQLAAYDNYALKLALLNDLPQVALCLLKIPSVRQNLRSTVDFIKAIGKGYYIYPDASRLKYPSYLEQDRSRLVRVSQKTWQVFNDGLREHLQSPQLPLERLQLWCQTALLVKNYHNLNIYSDWRYERSLVDSFQYMVATFKREMPLFLENAKTHLSDLLCQAYEHQYFELVYLLSSFSQSYSNLFNIEKTPLGLAILNDDSRLCNFVLGCRLPSFEIHRNYWNSIIILAKDVDDKTRDDFILKCLIEHAIEHDSAPFLADPKVQKLRKEHLDRKKRKALEDDGITAASSVAIDHERVISSLSPVIVTQYHTQLEQGIHADVTLEEFAAVTAKNLRGRKRANF